MHPENPVLSVSSALNAAVLRDLPTIIYTDRNWPKHREWMDALSREDRARVQAEERASGLLQGPTVVRQRRPAEHECLVTVFPQVWGSTALGYGGLGGCAMTTAYTVVVEAAVVRTRAVYFGATGRLAYRVPMGGANEHAFRDALASRAMPAVAAATELGWSRDGDCGIDQGGLTLTPREIARLALLVRTGGEDNADTQAGFILQRCEDGSQAPGIYARPCNQPDAIPILLTEPA